MNLIVDIGNTLVKLAVFDGGRIVAQRCVERLHPSMLGELLEGRRAAKAVVASTRGEADDVIETVRPYADYLLEFTSQTPVPVANAYHTPETLGRDRLVRYFVFNQRQIVVADRLNEYVFRRLRPEFVKLHGLCPPLVFLPLAYRAFRICATEKRMRFGLHTLCLFYLLR